LPWSFSSNSLAQLLSRKRAAGIPLLDLTISNPTQCLSDYPHAAIREVFGQIQEFTYSPDPFGSETARFAITEYYRKRGIPLTTRQLLLTASTSEAYSQLFKLLCGPGDEVLAPLPSYPLFEYLAALESVRMAPYRLRYDGSWHLDFASLRAQINRRTKAVIVVNPNNPTGTLLTVEEQAELLRLAQQFSLPVISDEVFTDFLLTSRTQTARTFIGQDSVLSFSLNGLSKTAGMPQMKLAWIAVNGPEQARQEACERLEMIADTYLSVSTPVQAALLGLLQIGSCIQEQLLQRIKQNLTAIDHLLQDTPAQRLPLDGGWSAILQLPRVVTEEEWARALLEEENVLVQPGYFFDMESEAYIVLSLITPIDSFRAGMERIMGAVARFS
jgi:aspartate/methionine/tyrosine aminotransferase